MWSDSLHLLLITLRGSNGGRRKKSPLIVYCFFVEEEIVMDCQYGERYFNTSTNKLN